MYGGVSVHVWAWICGFFSCVGRQACMCVCVCVETNRVSVSRARALLHMSMASQETGEFGSKCSDVITEFSQPICLPISTPISTPRVGIPSEFRDAFP